MKNSFSTTITTKYLPVTNTRPTRVCASFRGWNASVNWDYELDIFDNHRMAAVAVLKKAKADGYMCGYPKPLRLAFGSTDSGYCFVFAANTTKVSLLK